MLYIHFEFSSVGNYDVSISKFKLIMNMYKGCANPILKLWLLINIKFLMPIHNKSMTNKISM